MIVEKEEVWQ